MYTPVAMNFKLKCDICDQTIESNEFWFHKMHCRNVQFKKTKFVANKETLLRLFGRQAELLMDGSERGLNRRKVTSGSMYRIQTTKDFVKIDFNANVYTYNNFEAKILDLGLADNLHTGLGNDILLFTKNPCFDSSQIKFEVKNTATRSIQSVVLTIGITYHESLSNLKQKL